jgi:ankyrin repeat protein
VETADFLISKGASVNIPDNSERTPLYMAVAFEGNADMVKMLLKRGAIVDVVSKPDKTGFLHIAAQRNKTEVAKLLIAGGADVNATNILKLTPLHYAIKRRSIIMMKLLVESGADIYAVDTCACSPINEAFDSDFKEGAQYLLSRGANMEKELSSWSLGSAIRKHNLTVVDLLLSKGSDANETQFDGITPLQAALSCGDDKVVDLLITHGAKSGDIFEAACAGDCSQLKFFLDKDRKLVKEKGCEGETPLHRAAQFGRIEAAALLLTCGADPDALDDEKSTPYLWAREAGRCEMMDFLKEKGASTGTSARPGNRFIRHGTYQKIDMRGHGVMAK